MESKKIINKAYKMSRIMNIIIIFLLGVIVGILLIKAQLYFEEKNSSKEDVNLSSVVKEFTKTYKVENIISGEEENAYYVTLKLFQGEVDTVLITTEERLKEGKTYEFTFITEKNIEDTIDSIFKNSIIKRIEETNKEGLNQIQDAI